MNHGFRCYKLSVVDGRGCVFLEGYGKQVNLRKSIFGENFKGVLTEWGQRNYPNVLFGAVTNIC
jgi:hypothetical protein